MDEDQTTVEGEIVESGTATKADQGSILINMESMIKTHIASIDKLQIEAKKQKEMLDDIFNNDPTYKDHDEKVKEATKVKQWTRAQILKKPQAAELDQKVKELKSQLKENQASLSDYLQEYARLAGVNEIEGDDGEVREIIYTARLIKKSFNFKK